MAKTLPVIDLSSSREDGSGLAQVGGEDRRRMPRRRLLLCVNHGVDSALMAAAFAQSRRSSRFPSPISSGRDRKDRRQPRLFRPLHEALDPSARPRSTRGLQCRPRPRARRCRASCRQAFRSLNAWPELPGFRATLLAYYDACAALGAASIAPSPATSASRPTFSPKNSTARWRRCASCIIRRHRSGR